MRLSTHAFRTLWDLHAWGGVGGGLVLYVMFLAGAATLFRSELTLWQEPALHVPSGSTVSLESRVARALSHRPTPAESFLLRLPRADEPAAVGRIVVFPDTRERPLAFYLDGTTPTYREPLADFLYQLHVLRFAGFGGLYAIAGLLGAGMVVAILSGVLIHLHNLWRQLRQFRPRQTRRVLWSDMHKVLGVIGLPFQTLYALTGAMLILWVGAAGIAVIGAGRDHREQVIEIVRPEVAAPPAPTGDSAESLPVDDLLARALTAVPELEPEEVYSRGRGRSDGWLEVRGNTGSPFATATVWVRQMTGEVLRVRGPSTPLPMANAVAWVAGLHFARYGGGLVRLLLALLGILGGLTILTGNWIWLERRDPARVRLSSRALERVTVGVGGGAPVAIASVFVESRVIPFYVRSRGMMEMLLFAAVLLVCLRAAQTAKEPTTHWWKHLGVAGVLFTLTPLLAARLTAAGIFGRGPGIGAVIAVDLTLLVLGLALLIVAYCLRARSLLAPRPLSAASVAGAALFAPAAWIWPRGAGWEIRVLSVMVALMAAASVMILGSPFLGRPPPAARRTEPSLAPRANERRPGTSAIAWAALTGTIPPCLLAGLCLTRYWPGETRTGVAVTFVLLVPLWVAAICAVVVVPSARRAWALCGFFAVLLGMLALR